MKLTKQIEGSVTPEEASGALVFKVTGPEYPNGQEFTIGLGGFELDRATGKYVLTLKDIAVGTYTGKKPRKISTETP